MPSAQRGAFYIQEPLLSLMKNGALLFSLCIVVSLAATGQEKPLSPKETVSSVVGGVGIEIVYCRPSARGRKMVGGKDPYGQVWRTGANEATTIEFDEAVRIEGKRLPAGKYSLFTIPGKEEWVIIFNNVYDQWGHYNYNAAEDALRVTVKARHRDDFVETFTIKPEKDRIALIWENFYVAFRVAAI